MNKIPSLYLLLICCASAYGQSNAQQAPLDNDGKKKSETQRVVVEASKLDLEKSRDFAAGKIIIDRKQISESGLQNVEELLRRDPAVTVGKDGRISLLGLAGYTQTLVDGRASSGKNPLEMDLSEVERIEIIKSTTAQTGPYGIAGSINVISKKIERKRFQQATVGLQDSAGDWGGNASWSMNEGSMSSPIQWKMNASVNRRNSPSVKTFTQRQFDPNGQSKIEFSGANTSTNIVEYGNLVSGWLYRINDQQSLSIDPALGFFGMKNQSNESRWYNPKLGMGIDGRSKSKLTGFDFPLKWQSDLGENGELSVYLRRSRQDQNGWSDETNGFIGLPWNHYINKNVGVTDSYHFDVNYQKKLEDSHEISSGLKWSKSDGETRYDNFVNGQPLSYFNEFGANLRVREEKFRLFIQDEWRVNKTLSVNIGLSTEEVSRSSEEGVLSSKNQFRVWSPSFHMSKKLIGNVKGQYRFSLARSFKAPDSSQMQLRPAINSLAPCQTTTQCQPNTPDSADSAGNPYLQPERGVSLNASYEQKFGEDSQVSIESYLRKIDRKFGREIKLENVGWSSHARYVNRPRNLGDAEVWGVGLDWRIALRDIDKSAPKMSARGNLGFAQSSISDLPAPHNHVDGQLPWRAKLGLTYDSDRLPLKFNFDASWLPGDWIQNNLIQKTYESKAASYSAQVIWVTSKTMKFSFNVNNLVANTSQYLTEYQTRDYLIQRESEKKRFTQFGLRLEMKL